MTTHFQTLLLTGAAGFVGRHLAPQLLPLTARLRVSDLPEALARATLPAKAEVMPCELADAAAVHTLLRGVDAVVHLGGVSVEGPFEPILQANIRGLHNLYEGARRQGVKRVVFASSNHVTGCYEQALTAPKVGFLVAYGMSGNTRAFWNTQDAWAQLGFVPQDNSEIFAPQVEHLQQPEGPMRQLQGGLFLGVGPFDD